MEPLQALQYEVYARRKHAYHTSEYPVYFNIMLVAYHKGVCPSFAQAQFYYLADCSTCVRATPV